MSRIVVYVADHDELAVREVIEAALRREAIVAFEVTVEPDEVDKASTDARAKA